MLNIKTPELEFFNNGTRNQEEKMLGKFPNIRKLKNMLLKNPWVKESRIRKIL